MYLRPASLHLCVVLMAALSCALLLWAMVVRRDRMRIVLRLVGVIPPEKRCSVVWTAQVPCVHRMATTMGNSSSFSYGRGGVLLTIPSDP